MLVADNVHRHTADGTRITARRQGGPCHTDLAGSCRTGDSCIRTIGLNVGLLRHHHAIRQGVGKAYLGQCSTGRVFDTDGQWRGDTRQADGVAGSETDRIILIQRVAINGFVNDKTLPYFQ